MEPDKHGSGPWFLPLTSCMSLVRKVFCFVILSELQFHLKTIISSHGFSIK
jgi:hypothetical protein